MSNWEPDKIAYEQWEKSDERSFLRYQWEQHMLLARKREAKAAEAKRMADKEQAMNRVRERAASTACKHRGWVIPEVQDVFRFLCKECDARFERHPWLPQSTDRVKNEQTLDLLKTMAEFREGVITLNKAVTATNVSMEEFKKAMVDNFPPEPIYHETHLIGDSKIIKSLIGYEPARISDPEDIDEKFSTITLFRDGLLSEFPDVTDMFCYHNERYMQDEVMVHFRDGTKQLVIISKKDIAFTMPIVKQRAGGRKI